MPAPRAPGLAALGGLALAVAALAGCGGGEGPGDDGRPTALAALYPLAFAAEQIGGERVRVESLTPPGVEPHDLELSAEDVGRIADADVLLYLGGGFQPAIEDAAGQPARAVDLLGAVEPGAGGDPHFWLDPIQFAAAAEEIGRALDAEGAAAGFVDRLEELDSELEEGLADCERDTIVTSHAAFGYLAERYGLRQVAVTGLEPEAEPAPRELERVVEEVRASGATTVFVEPLVSPELAETVARETGAEVAVLDPLESLSDEQLAAGADYFSVMRDNLAALRAALGCR